MSVPQRGAVALTGRERTTPEGDGQDPGIPGDATAGSGPRAEFRAAVLAEGLTPAQAVAIFAAGDQFAAAVLREQFDSPYAVRPSRKAPGGAA